MKCPKCGYHSFDYLDSCKKCDNDLTSFKSKYNLRSLIFPKRLPVSSHPETQEATANELSPAAPIAAAAADFGFDFMDEDRAPANPKPEGLDLPELDEAHPAGAPNALPTTEDDTFSWDEEPETATMQAAVASSGGDDFEWDEESPQETHIDEEDALEETVGDDTFGLDLSWNTDLPALDEEQLEEEEPLEPVENAGLPDWDFEEEATPEAKKVQKPKDQEGPSHPFDLRGPGEVAPVPAPAETEGMIQPELPLERKDETTPGSLTGAVTMAATSVAATFVTKAPEVDDAEGPRVDPESAQPTAQTTPSMFARGLALLVDLLVLAGTTLLFLVAGEAALAPENSQRLLPSAEVLLTLAIPYFLVLFSVCFGYFTLFHFLTGQTPGKMLMRLRVETESGAPLAFSHAFLRSTGGLFSLLLLGFGFLAIFFDRRHRGWNDRFAGTQVVVATTATETPHEDEEDQK